MKKCCMIIMWTMIAALAFCLVGCSGGSSTQSNAASSSASSSAQSNVEVKEFDAPYYRKLLKENPAKATTEFEGNTYKVEGLKIVELKKDSGRVSNGKAGDEYSGIYIIQLPTEEIAKLNKDQQITFVGTIKKVPSVGETEFSDAYLVEE